MLPLLFHTHHSSRATDLPFWRELAHKKGGPILELGCGTGRVLIDLARKGYKLFGLDNDFHMLAFLRQQVLPDFSPKPQIFLSDMTNFRLAAQFSLITMPCNTISTLSSQQRRRTLERIYRHLLPGGMFAAALPNPGLLSEMPEVGESEVEDIFLHPASGTPVQVSSDWERTPTHFHLTWNYDLLYPNGTTQRVSARSSHSLEPLTRFVDDFVVAGFDAVELLGSLNFSPFKDDSENVVFLAEKPGG
jgi:SAM-dependent methyltransferase